MISEDNPPFGYLTKTVGQILMKVMEPILEKHQLTIPHWQVLNSIPFYEETKRKEILYELATRGWIDQNDLYEEDTNTLRLTRAGIAAQSTIFNEIHARRILLFKNITNEDFQITKKVMEQIIENEKALHKEKV